MVLTVWMVCVRGCGIIPEINVGILAECRAKGHGHGSALDDGGEDGDDDEGGNLR